MRGQETRAQQAQHPSILKAARMSRILFALTAVVATAFVITILAMVAMMLGDETAPINQWFEKSGGTLILVEVAGIVLFGLAAMTADRRETLREQAKQKSPDVEQ